jgi:hypothetical protein
VRFIIGSIAKPCPVHHIPCRCGHTNPRLSGVFVTIPPPPRFGHTSLAKSLDLLRPKRRRCGHVHIAHRISRACVDAERTQVATGMEFMEQNRMLHMDLAARNCLVGKGNMCKVHTSFQALPIAFLLLSSLRSHSSRSQRCLTRAHDHSGSGLVVPSEEWYNATADVASSFAAAPAIPETRQAATPQISLAHARTDANTRTLLMDATSPTSQDLTRAHSHAHTDARTRTLFINTCTLTLLSKP